MYVRELKSKKNAVKANMERIKWFVRRILRYKSNQYQRALINRNWYDQSARSSYPAIFIGGCGRSGTTLLREMLNRHSHIFCGPETSFFGLPFNPSNITAMWDIDIDMLRNEVKRHENLVSFSQWFFDRQSALAQKQRWADKTPNNVRAIGKILTQFPNSKFVHLIRDGRDVVCSLRRHPKERIVNGEVVPNKVDRPISQCATRWLSDTSAGLVYREHPRYMELKYEQLVAEPEQSLKRLCAFIDEDFEPHMLQTDPLENDGLAAGRFVNNPNSGQKIQRNRIGRWQLELKQHEREVFDNIAGELLYMLGYVEHRNWLDMRAGLDD